MHRHRISYCELHFWVVPLETAKLICRKSLLLSFEQNSFTVTEVL